MLTDKEKDIIFEMIQTRYLTLEQSNAIRLDDELAKQEVANYCAKKVSGIESQIANLIIEKEKYL